MNSGPPVMLCTKWTGSYRYDRRKHQTLIGAPETGFKIEITSFEAGKFRGKVRDDTASGGTPGEGHVAGHVGGDVIAWVKEMPMLTVASRKGVRTFANRRHPPIYYSGTLSADGSAAQGRWRMKLGFGLVGLVPALYLPISGTWQMSAAE